MEQFASGWKRNYYGKGDVIAYRLNRDGVTVDEQAPVFGASVKMLLYGDAFWPTYTRGDNTGLIATDSMKNFIQRETLNYTGPDLESYCHFLATKFLGIYPQVEGLQICATEIPYAALQPGSAAFAPAGPERYTARLEMNRAGTVEITAGIQGFRLLRLGGSAFHGFVRDEYTTLPDIKNRPLRMAPEVRTAARVRLQSGDRARVRDSRRSVRLELSAAHYAALHGGTDSGKRWHRSSAAWKN